MDMELKFGKVASLFEFIFSPFPNIIFYPNQFIATIKRVLFCYCMNP